MAFRRIILALFFFALSGCSQYGVLKSAIAQNGQIAADKSVRTSRWKHCQAETVGAIKRFYNTPEKMKKYNQFCGVENTSTTEIQSDEEDEHS